MSAHQAFGWQNCESNYPEKFTEARIIWLARLALCVLQILCEPESANFQHTIDRVVRSTDSNKGIRGVEVVPVFEIRSGLQELGGQREADRGEICYTDEPVGRVQKSQTVTQRREPRGAPSERTNFLRMPIKMRNLELSLWFSSGGCMVGGGVEVDDMVTED